MVYVASSVCLVRRSAAVRPEVRFRPVLLRGLLMMLRRRRPRGFRGRLPQCSQQVSPQIPARTMDRTAVKLISSGSAPGEGRGAGGQRRDHVMDEEERPGFLPGQDGRPAAQDPPVTPQRLLQVEERDFDLPAFSIQRSDLVSRERGMVRQGGQDPDRRGLDVAPRGAGGDGRARSAWRWCPGAGAGPCPGRRGAAC